MKEKNEGDLKNREERELVKKIRLLDIQSDRIVFETILDRHGVQNIPDELYTLVNQMAKTIGRQIKSFQGSFNDGIQFLLDQEISEDDAEKLEQYYQENQE